MLKKTNSVFSLAAMEKIMKKAGAERISDKAKLSLSSVLEDTAEEISKNAVRFAEHAGRKTIKKEDIRLAFTSQSS